MNSRLPAGSAFELRPMQIRYSLVTNEAVCDWHVQRTGGESPNLGA